MLLLSAWFLTLFTILITKIQSESFDGFQIAEKIDQTGPNVSIDQLNEEERAFATAFLNFGINKNHQFRPDAASIKSKVEVLSKLLKIHVNHLRDESDRIELVFLVDASGSVGIDNFRSELSFVRKLLSDFTVTPALTRVAVVTFADKSSIIRHIDQISTPDENNHKCRLLNQQLDSINYTGGGTYTRGALLEALEILENSRSGARKAIFLVTDGFSNGGDPRPAAKLLKDAGAIIYTFGIRTGNVEELHDIASEPGYTHSYLLDSFAQFEALARRALHRDLKAGTYITVNSLGDCDSLCRNDSRRSSGNECCDLRASCACGITSGHYACLCPPGYFGSGFYDSCHLCPNGTYGLGGLPGDSDSACTPCPDANHVTIRKPAISVNDCVCAIGYITEGNKCNAVTCSKLRVPENAYLVKASACTNVVYAACGIRCKIGFHLTGDSIRLCLKNGAWSGHEPQCSLKTCAALQAPSHGRIRCEHEDSEQVINVGSSAYPIDTNCQFKCDIGYQLRGSRSRNCLPLSRWDGLKVTCKPIRCQPLRFVPNGVISPDYCTGVNKLPFGTNCTVQCRQGFTLKGPLSKICGGNSGSWSHRHNTMECIDSIPPNITCPTNVTLITAPGRNYTLVERINATATDNSGIEPTLWSVPRVTNPWKIEIGVHTITYIARDSSENEARCHFSIHVIDKEPPVVENCVDPPIFLLESDTVAENVTWEEPVFYDNSELPVDTYKSHVPGEGIFKLGRTEVFYSATDASNNSANCVINVTVEDACHERPSLTNGMARCTDLENGVQCALTCDDGYALVLPETDSHPIGDNLTLTCHRDDVPWSSDAFPDCTITHVPYALSQDVSVILDSNETRCKDSETVVDVLNENIRSRLKSQLNNACNGSVECNVSRAEVICTDEEDNTTVSDDEDQVIGDKRRRDIRRLFRRNAIRKKTTEKPSSGGKKKWKNGHRRRTKIELKYKVIVAGQIIRDNRNNTEQGIAKLREKLEELTESGQLDMLDEESKQEVAELALHLDVIFKQPRTLCDLGSVSKKHICVKCPTGTFHNSTRRHCQACPFGRYQDNQGSTSCKSCPEHTYTKKMHSRNATDCIAECRPGFFSSRKRHHKAKRTIEPCVSCKLGSYQPDFGQSKCLSCPANTTTIVRGAVNVSQCVNEEIIREHSCDKNPCKNGGTCLRVGRHFECECRDNFRGTTCELSYNPCDSSPCLNGGICSVENKGEVNCACPKGHTGPRCEIYVDECTANPCQNNGTCVSTDVDFECRCRDGFEGETCEVKIDHCAGSPCEEGSKCRVVNGTWQCICERGYLGRRCNRLPCDWIPCHVNANCVNVNSTNTTKSDFRCECSEGYTGEDCTTRIDHCEHSPCLNNANCINHLTNYTCNCLPGYSGTNCEKELTSSYVMNFLKSGTTDYVRVHGPSKNLSEFTVCLWLQSTDTVNYGTVLSYATPHFDNALTLTDYNGFVLYVNGKSVVTDVTANDGYWHFLCVTWENSMGSWAVIIDGIIKDSGTSLANGTEIPGNGTMVIGQEQDLVGGGFSESESLVGKLTQLDIWDVILSNETIKNLTINCESYHGSLYNWAQLQEHVHGSIEIEKSSFCTACPTSGLTFDGTMKTNGSAEMIYSCERGYLVKFGARETATLKRRCLKYGQWEGHNEPICTRVKCGFPGYFLRGRISGNSYSYGDKIRYVCDKGSNLRGYSRRICQADGSWSGQQPLCIGTTCRNLLAPENGDITYIFGKHERNDTLILQVGQQLEFKCNPGYRVLGDPILTCRQNGKWDNAIPECVLFGCPPPKLMDNGYIATNIPSNVEPILEAYGTPPDISITESDITHTGYQYGDVVGISCYPGYRFIGNRNLITEFRIQCSDDGSWNGLAPDCIPLRCQRPESVENAQIYVISDDNERLKITTIRNNDTFSSANNETIANEKLEDSMMPVTEPIESMRTTSNDSFVSGTRIEIACDPGYKLIGSSSRSCTDNETWSSTTPRCALRQCDREKHPLSQFLSEIYASGGQSVTRDSKGLWQVVGKGTKFGDTVSIVCPNDTAIHIERLGDDATSRIKNITWICDSNGDWKLSNDAITDKDLEQLTSKEHIWCQRRSCRPPELPPNSYIVNGTNSSSNVSDDAITFGCRYGYELRGADTATCLEDGTWTPVPTCEPMTCGRLPTPPNAELLDANANHTARYMFGDSVWYRCLPGYVLSGPANARCLATGRWTKLTEMCKRISCGKPALIEGASIVGRSYFYQDRITYVCPNRNIQATATCVSDGRWSGLPNCTMENSDG